MKNFLTVQILPRLTERSTVLGAITLAITLLHLDTDAATADLLATAISAVTSLALILIRERTHVVVSNTTTAGTTVTEVSK